MKPTATHIKKAARVAKIARQQQTIQELTGMSDFQYKQEIFDFGMQFLHTLFTNDHVMIRAFSTQESYWKWFRTEWNNWQAELLEFVHQNKVNLTYELWVSETMPMLHDALTEQGFKNYLKMFHNIRL